MERETVPKGNEETYQAVSQGAMFPWSDVTSFSLLIILQIRNTLN